MRILKRKLTIIIITVITFGVFSGCSSSRVDLLNSITSRDTKAFHEMIDKVFAALDSEDKDELKSLFSVTAIEEISDLDSKIDEFFSVYNGPMEIEEISYSTSGGESIDYGKRQTRLHNSYDIIIIADRIRYHVDMVLYSQDDFNKDNEGIHILEFSTDEAINSQYYTSHISYKAGPGFYYQHSAEQRDDIKFIEDRPWDYTPYDRTLTAETIKSVVEKNDDYINLVAVIGEPNCSWPEYEYYYYELDNGLFAVIKLDNDSRPRDYYVKGELVELNLYRPNAIVAIYIADEKNNLETVWMADDIVKVLGSYSYFVAIDRVLSEDFFKSFASRSNSLSQLKDEIGLPNIDKPMQWQCFYKISDDRYVECYFLGDNIKAIYAVDSEDRLSTIWEPEASED